MIPIVHTIAILVTKPIISRMIPMAIMISPSRTTADSEFSQTLSRGSTPIRIGGAVTGTGVTGSRRSLGGVVTLQVCLP